MYNERLFAKMEWRDENTAGKDRNGPDRDFYYYVEVDDVCTCAALPHILNVPTPHDGTEDERVAFINDYKDEIEEKLQVNETFVKHENDFKHKHFS